MKIYRKLLLCVCMCILTVGLLSKIQPDAFAGSDVIQSSSVTYKPFNLYNNTKIGSYYFSLSSNKKSIKYSKAKSGSKKTLVTGTSIQAEAVTNGKTLYYVDAKGGKRILYQVVVSSKKKTQIASFSNSYELFVNFRYGNLVYYNIYSETSSKLYSYNVSTKKKKTVASNTGALAAYKKYLFLIQWNGDLGTLKRYNCSTGKSATISKTATGDGVLSGSTLYYLTISGTYHDIWDDNSTNTWKINKYNISTGKSTTLKTLTKVSGPVEVSGTKCYYQIGNKNYIYDIKTKTVKVS